ncbi:MAG TPA: hypothetical protein VFU86_16905 [Terriglobales bacterium]|nr:hypothetical protein [Terriglobales bacterium]
MSGVVIHFGVDSSYRLPLLQNAGFEVVDCGTSVPRFHRAVRNHEVFAVAVSHNASRELPIVEELRALKPVPLILFAGVDVSHGYPDFDLVIPSLTPPPNWLTQLSELLKKSKRVAEESAAIRAQSVTLRQQSAALRAKSASTRKRYLVERSRLPLDTDPEKTGELP